MPLTLFRFDKNLIAGKKIRCKVDNKILFFVMQESISEYKRKG